MINWYKNIWIQSNVKVKATNSIWCQICSSFLQSLSLFRVVVCRSDFRDLETIGRFFFIFSFHFSSVQSLSHVQLFATLWIATRQASLSINNSQSSLRFMSIESVMPSSHLILCHPLLLLPPLPPSIRVFSNEATLCMRWPKYWSFSFWALPY